MVAVVTSLRSIQQANGRDASPDRRGPRDARHTPHAAEWRELLQQLNRSGDGALVTVEVDGSDRGAVRRQARRSLRSIEYRAGDDVLVVIASDASRGVAELRYFIPAPRRVEITRAATTAQITVLDESRTVTMIRLSELAVCPPSALAAAASEEMT